MGEEPYADMHCGAIIGKLWVFVPNNEHLYEFYEFSDCKNSSLMIYAFYDI